LLLQVLFYSEMAKEQESFSIDDVLDRLARKLVDRHPHVFGDRKADTAAEVKRNWEALKVEERKKRLGKKNASDANPAGTATTPLPSILAGISSSMPSLLEAHKLSSRAAQIGFDWPEMEGLFEKLAEETRRTSRASAGISRPWSAPGRPRRRRFRTPDHSRGSARAAGRRSRRSFLRAG
jgi:ATP diphosphatase